MSTNFDFSIFGHHFQVASDSVSRVQEVAGFFRYYSRKEETVDSSDFLFQIVLHPEETSPIIPPDARHIHKFEMYPGLFFEVYERGNQVWTVVDQIDWTEVDYDRGEARIHVSESRLNLLSCYATSTLLFPIFSDYLQQHSHFFLHCAGLAKSDRGVLISGGSGAGKSTLGVALSRAGYDLLADDMCILSLDGGTPKLRGFCEDVALRPDAIHRIDGLDALADVPLRHAKVRLERDQFPGRNADVEATVRLVLLPQIHDGPHTLEPIPREEALRRLAFSGLYIMGTRGIQERTFALIDLLESADAYVLKMGPDMNSISGVVDSALESVVS